MRTLPKRCAACYNFPDWKFEWENRRISTQRVSFVVYDEVKTTKKLVIMGLYIYIYVCVYIYIHLDTRLVDIYIYIYFILQVDLGMYYTGLSMVWFVMGI